MAKEQIKHAVIEEKGNICVLTGEILPEDFSMFDTHRSIPKRKNGTYTLDNTGVALPTAHMVEHGTYRERPEELDTIKTMIDDRSQVMKLKNKITNQLLAYKRGTDNPHLDTVAFLENMQGVVVKELASKDKDIKNHIITSGDKLAAAALNVRGVGPITVAYCLAYIDLNKARHASCLWSYTGLHKASHERYQKGETSGGNKTLRTILYTMADSQVKSRGAYRGVYDNVKSRLEKSEKIVKSRNTKGVLVEVEWKNTKPSHRHGAALRAVMKHFLADYWWVGRTLAGLETSPLYPEAMLGGNHRTIMPEERGWEY